MFRITRAFILAAIALPALVFSQSDATVSSEPAETDTLELRKPRTWALSAEIGVNSLGSLLGPVGTWYVFPHCALDMGVGLSSAGLRPGLRARYLFSLEKTAFFAGLGLKYTLGTDGEYVKVQDPDTKQDLEIQIDGSGYADASMGVEYLADNGFLVIANAGYSQLLGGQNYHYRPGSTVSDKSEKFYKTILGSGVMLSVSLGKAF
ncbi:MAG: hypothetical protein M3Y08_08910 [Fibrobacterota bacterium]|nr:hypothetical protein [Fibrobacterota bacterium]